LRHGGLLQNKITEGRMKGKPTRGRKSIQMLHDLANDDGFVALKRTAEDREGWRQREGCQKPSLQQKTTELRPDPSCLPQKSYRDFSGAIFLQARCPSCHPTNSVKALKEL